MTKTLASMALVSSPKDGEAVSGGKTLEQMSIDELERLLAETEAADAH
jgi:hypothetical protein